MADEISVTMRLSVTNGQWSPGIITVNNATFDQAAIGAASGVQAVGTSEEELATGDLSTKGWLFLKNLDTTNYIQVGFSTTVYGIRLEAGESAMFRTEPAATVYLKANTAACKLQYQWLED
jgi:hypothetical protein